MDGTIVDQLRERGTRAVHGTAAHEDAYKIGRALSQLRD